jgi:hypothetical protein
MMMVILIAESMTVSTISPFRVGEVEIRKGCGVDGYFAIGVGS